MKLRKQDFVLLLAFILMPQLAWGWEGKVVSVSNGDGITVKHEGKNERIQLYGVSCPVKHQEFADNARRFTSDLVLGKIVEIEPVAKDRFGRTVASVALDGRSLGRELLRFGLGWVHRPSCTRVECEEWKHLERVAKRQKAGLWSTSNPIPPWEFRHKGGTVLPVYHGDIVGHVFHSSNCEDYDCKNCIAPFRGREKAVAAGYRPCAKCSP